MEVVVSLSRRENKTSAETNPWPTKAETFAIIKKERDLPTYFRWLVSTSSQGDAPGYDLTTRVSR